MSSTDTAPRTYEVIFIVQPDLNEDEVAELDGRFVQLVTDSGGEIVATEYWGRRRLAYPIQNHFEGYYVLRNVSVLPQVVEIFERFFRFSEDVIRYRFELLD